VTSARRSVLGVCGGLLAATAAGAASGGCTVGSGSGAANGPLWLIGCTGPSDQGGDLGEPNNPVQFQLDPTFFAGDPIEGTSVPPINRLVIRMQRNGSAIQYNDTLTFDIQNAYEVARCVRGRIDPVTGQPDWDVVGQQLGAWCDWSAEGFGIDGGVTDGGVTDGGVTDAGAPADGGVTPPRARIHLTSQGYVQASLGLLASCPLNLLDVTGPALVGHSVDGWLEFQDFGSAAQPDKAPTDRDAFGPAKDFKVNFGERLRGTFHVVLEDDRVLTAIQTEPTGPIPAPLMGATLDGNFDFDLLRARAAQPFP
jgi:hypothetical protein